MARTALFSRCYVLTEDLDEFEESSAAKYVRKLEIRQFGDYLFDMNDNPFWHNMPKLSEVRFTCTGDTGAAKMGEVRVSYDLLAQLKRFSAKVEVVQLPKSLPSTLDHLGLIECDYVDNAEELSTCRYSLRLSHPSDNIPSLKRFQRDYNTLTVPPTIGLPSGLKYLDCSFNQIESIDNLPSSLEALICNFNRLKSLPILPKSLKMLSCSDNPLKGYFSSSNSQLLPPFLKALIVIKSCRKGFAQPLPSGLLYLICGHNNLTSLPLLPPALEVLDCSKNKMQSLPPSPTSLKILRCSENELTFLPTLPKSIRLIALDARVSVPPIPVSRPSYLHQEEWALSYNWEYVYHQHFFKESHRTNFNGNIFGQKLMNEYISKLLIYPFRDKLSPLYMRNNPYRNYSILLMTEYAPSKCIFDYPDILETLSHFMRLWDLKNLRLTNKYFSESLKSSLFSRCGVNIEDLDEFSESNVAKYVRKLEIRQFDDYLFDMINFSWHIMPQLREVEFTSVQYTGYKVGEARVSYDLLTKLKRFVARVQHVELPKNLPSTLKHLELIDCDYVENPEALSTCRYSLRLRDVSLQSPLALHRSLTHLDIGLKYLDCRDNELISTGNIPSSLEVLICDGNKLKSLDLLPPSLKMLSCSDNPLEDYFSSSNSQPLPQSLKALTIRGGALHKGLGSALPSGLLFFDCSENKLTSLPLLPTSLQHLECSDNRLLSLPPLPTTLQILRCGGNELTCLPMLPKSIRRIDTDVKLSLPLPSFIPSYTHKHAWVNVNNWKNLYNNI
ncbi:hypothetical protein BKA69DRAFT_1126641 [Paraphysoderma sedebokerense]|nr:hypothetical protein BKA69DRAFT_1126641 [Paraphysoderma sedebokerense]